MTIGGAIGPSIGGFALGGISFWLFGVFGVLVVTVALILALIAGSRFSRSAAQPI